MRIDRKRKSMRIAAKIQAKSISKVQILNNFLESAKVRELIEHGYPRDTAIVGAIWLWNTFATTERRSLLIIGNSQGKLARDTSKRHSQVSRIPSDGICPTIYPTSSVFKRNLSAGMSQTAYCRFTARLSIRLTSVWRCVTTVRRV